MCEVYWQQHLCASRIRRSRTRPRISKASRAAVARDLGEDRDGNDPNERTDVALLDDGAWQGKVWTGAWTDGSGGTYDAVEPATGDVIAPVGKATPEDVHAAAERAAAAQRAWAAAPFEERARVLRRVGPGVGGNADAIKGRLARGSWGVQPFGDFQRAG